MPPKKRAAPPAEDGTSEPVAKRRSARQAAAAPPQPPASNATPPASAKAGRKSSSKKDTVEDSKTEAKYEPVKHEDEPSKPKTKAAKPKTKAAKPKAAPKSKSSKEDAGAQSDRAVSEDPDPKDIPKVNPEAPRHDGEWYWLMKAEPESRFENGIDVRFSIDDLRAKTKPEGWDGIRAYPARNHMRNMNAGDKAFFYHSNCKEPAIVGIMEIVREFSEDKSARRPGTPYYDPSSTRENPRWSLVHVEFRRKLAVPIGLKELRELGKPGGALENMQMLKQSRLSVSRVSAGEWKALCELADRKAKEAGLEHQEGKP